MYARGFIIAIVCLYSNASIALSEEPLKFNDKNAQRYKFEKRASELDKRVKSYPEINFLLEKEGKPQDVQHASVDTRVEPLGKLVIWMMAPNDKLFERLNSYGLHAIRVHYANGWFGTFGKNSTGQHEDYLGKIRWKQLLVKTSAIKSR